MNRVNTYSDLSFVLQGEHVYNPLLLFCRVNRDTFPLFYRVNSTNSSVDQVLDFSETFSPALLSTKIGNSYRNTNWTVKKRETIVLCFREDVRKNFLPKKYAFLYDSVKPLSSREKGWHSNKKRLNSSKKKTFWDYILWKSDGLADEISMYRHCVITNAIWFWKYVVTSSVRSRIWKEKASTSCCKSVSVYWHLVTKGWKCRFFADTILTRRRFFAFSFEILKRAWCDSNFVFELTKSYILL